MRIHCICLVRDEADILAHTLEAALPWAHAIYVLDNGSTDGSREILQEYARRSPRVKLLGPEPGPFRSAMWGEVATCFLDHARPGDWWCRLDADELYIDDPLEVLAGVDPRDDLVFSTSIHYYFTDLDLAEFERDPGPFLHGWRPELLRYYLANWSEPRFVRHHRWARWRDEWPAGFWHMRPAGTRIRLRHFQYRSPPQIARRLQARITRTQHGRFAHEKTDRWVPNGLREEDVLSPALPLTHPELWRTRVVRAAALRTDDGSEPVIDAELLPPIWIRPSRARRALAWLRSWR
jgi:glycosyltransferase involved in cell wall biosynthesis